MQEVHLLIIWSKALSEKQKILDDLKDKLEILDIYNITWSLDKFSENLSRFYGENLPKNSFKEEHCGNNTFTCIVVRDKLPIYELRATSKGNRIVNSKLFDIKQLYRSWTGGGHKIHATDNIDETKLQLALLLGMDYNLYLNKQSSYPNEVNYEKNLMGSSGWSSFEELFHVLNLTAKYVILRNYDDLNMQLDSLHPDIDLLIEDKNLVSMILNASPTTELSYRVQYSTIVKNKMINFDLRYVGDNYYCYEWERKILYTRKKYKYFYVPEDRLHFYSLIYHALVHKESISSDYIEQFQVVSKKLSISLSMVDMLEVNLLNILLKYMDGEKYTIVEPDDETVMFNRKLISKKVYIKTNRKVPEIKISIRKKIKLLRKRIIKKLGF